MSQFIRFANAIFNKSHISEIKLIPIRGTTEAKLIILMVNNKEHVWVDEVPKIKSLYDSLLILLDIPSMLDCDVIIGEM